jgi:hypothetical protein
MRDEIEERLAALRELLREQAILRAAPGQPIQSPDGEQAPWMFYSWQVTLAAGARRSSSPRCASTASATR